MQTNREKVIVRTSIVGIIGNLLLVAAKAVIGFISGSISIVLDAVNNLTDSLSSIITIIGTKLSNRKPSKKHPFGLGRIEYLTSLIIAIIILFAGGMAIYESIKSLINHEEASYTYISIIIVSIAIATKIGLGLYFTKMGKKVNSKTLIASGKDALFDAALSGGTLIGIIVMMTTGVAIEGYLGIVIGLFILKGGFGVLAESLSSIIGERADPKVVEQIIEMVMSYKEVKGAYDLIINNYGVDKGTGSIHIEVDDNMTAKEIHPLTRKISEDIYMKFNIIMTVGIYASNDRELEIQAIKENLQEILKKYPEVIQMHAFYLDRERKLISFDIVVSFDCKDRMEIRNKINEEIAKLYPDYNFVIVLDSDFSN